MKCHLKKKKDYFIVTCICTLPIILSVYINLKELSLRMSKEMDLSWGGGTYEDVVWNILTCVKLNLCLVQTRPINAKLLNLSNLQTKPKISPIKQIISLNYCKMCWNACKGKKEDILVKWNCLFIESCKEYFNFCYLTIVFIFLCIRATLFMVKS